VFLIGQIDMGSRVHNGKLDGRKAVTREVVLQGIRFPETYDAFLFLFRPISLPLLPIQSIVRSACVDL